MYEEEEEEKDTLKTSVHTHTHRDIHKNTNRIPDLKLHFLIIHQDRLDLEINTIIYSTHNNEFRIPKKNQEQEEKERKNPMVVMKEVVKESSE